MVSKCPCPGSERFSVATHHISAVVWQGKGEEKVGGNGKFTHEPTRSQHRILQLTLIKLLPYLAMKSTTIFTRTT